MTEKELYKLKEIFLQLGKLVQKRNIYWRDTKYYILPKAY